MRIRLKDARKQKNMTQAEVAAYLKMKTTSYQRIESGSRKGDIDLWDALEDLFGIPQRQLREKQNEPGGNQTKGMVAAGGEERK